MFKIRTTPVEEGNPYYTWNVPSVYQCTWYVYNRISELNLGWQYPTWWDRATQTGSYPNANDWLANYRDPWQVKGTDYTPVAGDIAVYGDSAYGHVMFFETDTMTSEYRSGRKDSFRNAKFGDYKGNLLGFLHYPYKGVPTVERDTSSNQIEVLDDLLRIRTKPSLDADIVGHCQLGYYNVLQSKDNDGYTWYEIAKNRWCANVSVNYLPKQEDIIGEIERYFNAMRSQIESLESESKRMKQDIEDIDKIAEKWIK